VALEIPLVEFARDAERGRKQVNLCKYYGWIEIARL
jgi:hypothetical protein